MALAPEQAGIGIRRYFTTAGVHPYDELRWERRDARITNWKDGSVAFEQPDVEFPVDWSLNATNIVAQKYFRGTLGTPERESSLRQVADRVVDTITRWGVEGGYFVDAGEAETFNAELKHLIVTQKAAFNSPVWFNIGVPGVPQQGSACFILSVDDTMDSILNWYKEEGTIFKGGSGAGVNLSRIRSSFEHLKGGGTASGPVSFMRGADASAGTIKCLHEHTELRTDHGVVPIRDVRAGWKVLTRHGHRAVEAVHDNGVRPLVVLRTALGDELRCTSEHRFLVRTSDGERWRRAGELGAGDHIVIDLDAGDEDGARQPLEPEPTRHHRERPHELPAVLDEAFALWLGWNFGDGSVTSRPNARFIAVQLGDEDPELNERYRALTRSVFGAGTHFFESRHEDKDDRSLSLRFSSHQVIRFLERNGLRKQECLNLQVPGAIKSSPPAVRAAFLSGLFESDGFVTNGYAWFSSASRQLALDVHRLLLSLGIPSIVSTIADRRNAYGDQPTTVVRVVGAEGTRRFAKRVGFISERKSRALEVAVARRDDCRFETQWHLPEVAAELSNVWEATSDQRLRRALAPYCRYALPRRMSLLRARVLLDQFPEELVGTSLARFALGQDFYTTVTVSAAGEGQTFDLTVERVHQYLVNGIVTHNSGGKTRRAAKMVILDVDHPDVEEFIWVKAREEQKIRVLRDAGFEMDLDGRDMASVQYQNANNSVRVTDEFMRAVEADADWQLRAVTTGEVVRTVRARDLFRQIALAAWECADPGMQFDTTINHWHTAATTGRINGSNPCFPGDALVHTDKGLVRFDELVDRVREGETFGVYTHDATNPDAPAERLELTSPNAVMITGRNEIVKLTFSNGMQLRCTPNHRIFTTNRGYVAAEELTADDLVKVLDLPAPPVHADEQLPVTSDVEVYNDRDVRATRGLELPEKWSEDLAHYLGWLVGDGCIAGDTTTTVYGNDIERGAFLPRHSALLAGINGGRVPKPSIQANGTVQLPSTRSVVARWLEALGVSNGRAATKRLPWSVEQAPTAAAAAFLRGLFDADGCVYDGAKYRYVGLASVSPELVRGVQRVLSTLGVESRIYATGKAGDTKFVHVDKAGTVHYYDGGQLYDLRITRESVARFAEAIGFDHPAKAAKLATLLATHSFYRKTAKVRLVERVDDGVEQTYNLSEPRNHSYIVNGIVVRNCSEYMHLDNSACNLASLNLLKFLRDGDADAFDVDGFEAAVEVVFTAQEILVGRADYPTEAIAETSRRFRQLGLGYANLGALLMALGLPYDSGGGRAWAGAITALMTGHAYEVSARTAARMGPFAGYGENREHMLRVLDQHRQAAASIDEELVPAELLSRAQSAWDNACDIGAVNGVRNSQATVLAPTGTIGLMMDCDTTGIEPDLGLVKMKKLVGGGTMSIVNQTVPRALRRLGYGTDEIAEIIAYVDEHKSIIGAPHLRDEDLTVFACSMGDNTIHYMGHTKMMGAVQPFISGAISKTVNMPEEATVEEVEQLHLDAWKLGLKAVAIYRDNCKVGQPLSTAKKDTAAAAPDATASPAEVVERIVERVVTVKEPVRQKMPRSRSSRTFDFRVADCKGFVTVGEYEDGRPGEIFIRISKQGSTLAGIMDAFAISVSYGLQYGVPLRAYVETLTNTRFEPAGMTDDADIRFASSLVDYIFRRLAVEYLSYEERAELGILTIGERTQPTLPGVEETAVETRQGSDIVADPPSIESAATLLDLAAALPAPAEPAAGQRATPTTRHSDAPLCMQCGVQMQRAGSCHACPSCGNTSGCS